MEITTFLYFLSVNVITIICKITTTIKINLKTGYPLNFCLAAVTQHEFVIICKITKQTKKI